VLSHVNDLLKLSERYRTRADCFDIYYRLYFGYTYTDVQNFWKTTWKSTRKE